MKRNLMIVFQVVVLIIGIIALVFLLVEPHFEGRNVNATLYQIYFNDPFLAYAYASSILFFVGLYKVFVLLGDIWKNKAFSQNSLRMLRTVKHCAMSLVVLILLPVIYLFVVRPDDDIAGGVVMGLFLIFVFVVVTIVVGVVERRMRD